MKNHKVILKIGVILLALGLAATLLGVLAVVGAYFYVAPGLPAVDTLKDIRLQEPFRIYTRDNKLLAEFGEQRRIPLDIADIPERLQQAFLAAEDDRFFIHPGVDYQGMTRAVMNQVLKGDRSQGGSTITMQLARNFFLSNEKTYIRKINEIFLALRIEKELSKEKILELYLNKIFLGRRAYGIAAAAQIYYGKSVDQLTLAETAMIAGLPKAPSAFNPIANPRRALARRNYVLGRMRDLGMISPAEYDEAAAEPNTAGAHEIIVDAEAAYIAEMARLFVIERFGEEAYNAGLKVHTTIDSRLQAAANNAVRNGLLDYEQRQGYRGPIRQFEMPGDAQSIMIAPDKISGETPETGAATEDISDEALLADEDIAPTLAQPAVAYNVIDGVLELPRADADSQLISLGSFGNIKPGLVLGFGQTESTDTGDQSAKVEKPAMIEYADVYLGGDLYTRLVFDDVSWARRYLALDQRGPEPKTLRDVLATGDFIWLRPADGQRWTLAQLPQVEGALVSLDPRDGAVVSLVGGFDYFKSKFNRVVQARRQAGSSFKPFVYSAALDNGFTAASILNDAPVVFDDPSLEGKWRPENYSGEFFGPTRLRVGLAKSRNLVSIRLLIAVGVNKARVFARKFGFPEDSLPANLSLVLGAGTVTPMELTAAYAVFANEGYRIEPYFIDRIEDAAGKTLWLADYNLACLDCFLAVLDPLDLEQNYRVEYPPASETTSGAGVIDTETRSDNPGVIEELAGVEEPSEVETLAVEEPAVDVIEDAPPESETGLQPGDEAAVANGTIDIPTEDLPPPKRVLRQAERVLTPQNSYIMNSMLRDVIQQGTGARALSLGRNDLAGKTGTTNDQHDAWFNGYNHQYVASVWTGYDAHLPLGAGEAGARAALPIWMDYMKAALDGVPEVPLTQPEGIVSRRIDARTGLLATPATQESLFEIFQTGTEPVEESDNDFESDPYTGTTSATNESDGTGDLF